MILRRATSDDAAALTTCIEAAYAPYEHLGLPPVAEGVAAEIAQHDVWVAIVDGAVRGGIVLHLGDTAHVINLAVHPDAGGQGVGGALMQTAEQAARDAGFDAMMLATHVDMTRTQAFYTSVGWVETGREANKVYFTKQLN
ncbi:MAG: GNAT family N-acetyltransferase [Yoonia sp.]|uniref:GNAT family N-acetyltransferase n=1 Tax=Yoonia sp. TaxID=2212373 RepID=UPI003EFAEB5C